MFGLLVNQEALMNSSFLELLREEVGDYYTDLVDIDGGMDHLPRALPARARAAHPLRRARWSRIDQSEHDVTVHYQTAAGRLQVDGRLRDHHRAVPGAAPRRGAEAVLAAQAARDPPAALRRLGQDPPPVPAPVLGGGRRHLRRRHGHRPRRPQRLLPRPRARDRAAA